MCIRDRVGLQQVTLPLIPDVQLKFRLGDAAQQAGSELPQLLQHPLTGLALMGHSKHGVCLLKLHSWDSLSRRAHSMQNNKIKGEARAPVIFGCPRLI